MPKILTAVIIIVVMLTVFAAGIIWVGLKQKYYRGFWLAFFLASLIIYRPLTTLLLITYDIIKFESIDSLQIILHLAGIAVVIHGAYWGLKFLTITEVVKGKIKLNFFLSLGLSLVKNYRDLLYHPERLKTLTSVAFVLMIGIWALFYVYLTNLKSDEDYLKERRPFKL